MGLQIGKDSGKANPYEGQQDRHPDQAGAGEDLQITVVGMEDIAGFVTFRVIEPDGTGNEQIRIVLLNIPGTVLRRESEEPDLLSETDIVSPDLESAGGNILLAVLSAQDAFFVFIFSALFCVRQVPDTGQKKVSAALRQTLYGSGRVSFEAGGIFTATRTVDL